MGMNVILGYFRIYVLLISFFFYCCTFSPCWSGSLIVNYGQHCSIILEVEFGEKRLEYNHAHTFLLLHH